MSSSSEALMRRLPFILTSAIPSFGAVGLGGFLAYRQHASQPFTFLNYLDLVGVFFNLSISSLSYLQLINSNENFDNFKRDFPNAAAWISLSSYLTFIAVLFVSFCAALLIDKSDLQGHTLAIALIFLLSLWQSTVIWNITRRRAGAASIRLRELARDWTLRYDLPDTLAYLLIALILFYKFSWQVGGEPDSLEVLHGFVTGAVSLHLSLSAWTFLLDNLDVIRGSR
jgi:hypothetical protein